MSSGRFTGRRRTRRQVRADERAEQLARYLGRALRDGRLASRSTQRSSADEVGLAQSTWSLLERGSGSNLSLRVWVRATWAVNSDLRAYLERATATTGPRDAVHLRHQELVIRTALAGGWRGRPEAAVAGDGEASPVADILLARGEHVALCEVWDWFADVGESLRSWDRKLARLAAQTGSTPAACWVVRATRQNRRLVSDHSAVFASRFPGSAAAWLSALTDLNREEPAEPALLWVTVRGDRLVPWRPRRR